MFKTHRSEDHPETRTMEPLAVTRERASAMLGISPVSLDRLVKRGLIHPSRALRRPLFPLAELNRFLSETQTMEKR